MFFFVFFCFLFQATEFLKICVKCFANLKTSKNAAASLYYVFTEIQLAKYTKNIGTKFPFFAFIWSGITRMDIPK